MANFYLASGGNNIKIWKDSLNKYAHVCSLPKKLSAEFVDLSWNSIGSKIIGALKSGEALIECNVTNIHDGILEFKDFGAHTGQSCITCSRKFADEWLSGGTFGDINFWLSSHVIHKQIQLSKYAILKVKYNLDETVFAAGTEDGKVYVRTTSSPLVSQQVFSISDDASITDLKFTNFDRNRFAVASADGYVGLWNINYKFKSIYQFRVADGYKTTALAFAPENTNSKVLISVGENGKVYIIDANHRSHLFITCNHPLRSVCFHPDGDLFVVGDDAGGVALYDVRNNAGSLLKFNAFHGPVNVLEYCKVHGPERAKTPRDSVQLSRSKANECTAQHGMFEATANVEGRLLSPLVPAAYSKATSTSGFKSSEDLATEFIKLGGNSELPVKDITAEQEEESEGGKRVEKDPDAAESQATMQFDTMPEEDKIQVFREFTHVELINCIAKVCTSWKSLALSPSLWQHVNVDETLFTDDAIYDIIESMIAVVRLKLNVRTKWILLNHLPVCNRLTNLKIETEEMPLEVMKLITEQAAQLKSFKMKTKSIVAPIVAAVTRWNLRKLKIFAANVALSDNDSIIKIISTFKQLEHLGLTGGFSITDGLLKELAHSDKDKLKCFDIDTRRVTSTGFVELVKFPNLIKFHVTNVNAVSQVAFVTTFQTLKKLKKLTLSETAPLPSIYYADTFRDNPFENLINLKLIKCSIDEHGLLELAKSCSAIEVLYLVDCPNVTDDGLDTVFTICRRLRHVGLSGLLLVTGLFLFDHVELLLGMEFMGFSECPLLHDSLVCLTGMNDNLVLKKSSDSLED